MDMLSPPKQKTWPNAPAKRGEFYGLTDPVRGDQMLVVMSNDTWLDVGTELEKAKRVAKERGDKIVELNATNAVLVAQLAALQDKHAALREQLKKHRLNLVLNPKDKGN